MTSQVADGDRVAEAFEALRHELARLGERVAALEARAGFPRREPEMVVNSIAQSPATAGAGLDEETLLVISAAIAAILGKKAHVRQIRLVGTTAWTQQGRVTIQTSHALAHHHG